MSRTDYFQVLTTINEWIHNCDTKASILLGIIGVMLSFILSSDFGVLLTAWRASVASGITYFNLIWGLLLWVSAFLLVYGLIRLILVLVPKIDANKSSLMFFGGITRSADNPDCYKEKIHAATEQEILDDLAYQIYAAARIATQKFSNQKKGTIFSCIGLALFLVWIIGVNIFLR